MTVTPTPSPSSTRTTAFVVVLVAFIAGLFVGIAGDRLYFHRRFPGPRDFTSRRIVDRLDHELHLSSQQKTEVQQIIDRHRVRIDTVIRPQMRQELDAMNAEIDKVLTPDQRAEFAKMRARMPGRRGMGGGGPPPPQ